MFYRITRELDPGIANFRNLRQDWFLLGAIGDLSGEHPIFINHLILNSAERPGIEFYTCRCTYLVQQLLNFIATFLWQKALSSIKLRANGRNNSQHGWASKIGSCCVRVGSGVQMRMQQLPTTLAYHACWSITRSCCIVVSKETISNARACPQQCWKSFKNGPNIVVLLCRDHGAKEILGVVVGSNV